MNDGLGAGEAFDGLAEVGDVGVDERIGRLRGRSDVDAGDVVPVLEQVATTARPALPLDPVTTTFTAPARPRTPRR